MSSGFSYPQPIFTSPIYNPAFYLTLDASGFLTYDYAQTLYLDKNDYRLTYLTGITTGIATPGVALVPGSGGNITGIGALSCSSLTVNGTEILSAPSYVQSITPGTAANGKASVLSSSGTIGTIASLTATSITGKIQTAAQPKITSVGTLSNLTLNTAGTGLYTPNIQFWYNSAWTNFDHSMYVGITQGSGTASKAMVLNSTGQISGINYLQAATINAGTLQIGSTAITATAAQINSLASISATPTELNYLDLYDAIGIAQTSRALVLDASGSCTGIASLKGSILISSAMTRWENTPNTIISLTSDMNAYNLILRNQTSSGGVANACCGIAFHADAHGDSWFASNSGLVPGAAIVAFKPVSTLNGQTGLSFRLKGTGGTAASTQFEALRIAPDGKISFSDTIGDMQWNMLRSAGTCALRFGTSLSTKNCCTIQWNYAGAASDSNCISFDTYGTSNTLVLTANDRVGISTAAPGAKLHVVGGVAITMAGPSANGISSAYLVNQASAGSITDTIGAWVEQGLRVGSRGIYVGSDRRVKTNIADIPDEDGVEFVKSIKPKLYELKGGNKRQTGYIAQDLIESYSCMLQFCPSSSMRIEEEGDIDGCFINLDYMRVIPMLHAALRDCLSRIEELETKLCSR